jgi:hypothetical protein
MTNDPEKRRINNARAYAKRKADNQNNSEDHNMLDVTYWK